MRWLLGLLLLLAAPLWAQTYPDYTRVTVNDYAGLLGDDDEQALHTTLDQLRHETGVELSVLTLPTQADYAPDMTLEAFATGLFDHWGIGDANRNDGVLVLILKEDRAMRIELGAGYGRDWDRVAAQVIDTDFLPEFANGRFDTGIIQGVNSIIARIVRPFQNGANADFPTEPAASPPPSETDRAPGVDLVNVAIGAAVFVTMLLAALRHKITDFIATRRPCPRCGQRTLQRKRKRLSSPTRHSRGSGRVTTTCRNCTYAHRRTYSIARLRSSSSSSSRSSFGGGRSGGGGASGRW